MLIGRPLNKYVNLLPKFNDGRPSMPKPVLLDDIVCARAHIDIGCKCQLKGSLKVFCFTNTLKCSFENLENNKSFSILFVRP